MADKDDLEVSVELLLHSHRRDIARIVVYRGTVKEEAAVVIDIDLLLHRNWQQELSELADVVFRDTFVNEMLDTLIEGLQELKAEGRLHEEGQPDL